MKQKWIKFRKLLSETNESTNSDFICEYFTVRDPWPASEAGIPYVFTTLPDSAGRNGNHGWYLQAEAEARLILVRSISAPTPPTHLLEWLSPSSSSLLRRRWRSRSGTIPPPSPTTTQIPPHGPFWYSRSQREEAVKRGATWRGVAYPFQYQRQGQLDIAAGRLRMEPSKFILLLNICCIASPNS